MFKVIVYYNGDFVFVLEENFKGKWFVVVFYLVDFMFVCLIELGDFVDCYVEF